MTLTKPEKYVVIPAHAIEQAFTLDKPRRALLGTYVRLLSLAWETNYEQTPRMREDNLYDIGETRGFLRLSRRQYFEQKADMELLGWLRSSHPVPGFVQFSFSKSAVSAMQTASAENRTDSAENRTVSAENRTAETRNEEDDSRINLIKSSSSFNPLRNEVRKTAQLFEHLALLFDPVEHGVLEVRDVWLVLPYEYVLGWIAKAFHDRLKLTRSGPLGLIVARLNDGKAPDRFYMTKYADILPNEYLEAIGEIEYSCDFCAETFEKRAELDEHVRSSHPYICEECQPAVAFGTQADWQAHYAAQHDPYERRQEPTADVPALDGELGTAWESVLRTLQEDMPRASFDTWVRDTHPIRYDGNVLQVGTRNAYAADWLTQRLSEKASTLAGQVLKQAARVVFVVGDAA